MTMPDPFSVLFLIAKVSGIVLALLAAGYLVFDNLLYGCLSDRTTVKVVLEGRVRKRDIVRLLEEHGYKVVKWK